MDATQQPSGSKRGVLPIWAGELIVQSGRQNGARRPLQIPLTVIGKAAGCDIRLNSTNIGEMHCLLVHGPTGLMIRDLDSANGTFVNGERTTSLNLKDGDLLTIGSFQFRLHLPPRSFAIPDQAAGGETVKITESDQDALRLQAAAVAAQQCSLGEEEANLQHRKASLERQEEQLASHLEEKRRKLQILNDRAQAERQSLQQDRLAYEQHIEKITSDLSAAQREVLQNQEQFLAERRRLAELYRRLRGRLHEQLYAQKQKVKQREDDLITRAKALEQENLRMDQREQKIEAMRLEFNADYTTGRNQLKDGWQRLRQAQHAWRQRRGQERQVLKQRGSGLEDAQKILEKAQRDFLREKEAWNIQRHTLDQDVAGLETRVRNQRQRIIQQQLEINRLDNLVRLRQGTGNREQGTGNREQGALVPVPCSLVPVPCSLVPVPCSEQPEPADDKKRGRPHGSRSKLAKINRELENEVQDRLAHLERLAGDLADQRLLLLEQWQRLVQTQNHWENDHTLTANELEALTLRLREQEQDLNQRERSYEQAEHQFRLRHRELTHLRQHLVAWRARLKTRENVLEGEREQLLTDVQSREELVEKQLSSLTELRRRWTRRRRRELTQLHSDCTAYDRLLQECNLLRQTLADRTSELEEEKRKLTEKTLALEQYRQEFFVRADHPHAERRLERLRRRWLAQNAAAVRNLTQQRETLQTELAAMQNHLNELVKRQQLVTQAEDELTDKQTTFEHQQVLAAVRTARLEQDLQSAESQRQLIEQQLGKMKEEIERIARQLLEEPEPQTPALDQAA